MRQHAVNRWGDLGVAVAVHVGRFGVILLGLLVAPLLDVTGWYAGLLVNVLCAAYAIVLMSAFRLWRASGFLTLGRGRRAALLALVPLAEAVSWAIPGLADREPGFGLWALTLLLVGFNEELVSRGVVLARLSRSFPPVAAVALTAALFGFQHLSLFATTSRDAVDILTNVLASACYGFALAAFQWRFRWIWPLILVHALADFFTILSRDPWDDPVIVAMSVGFVAFGALLLGLDRRPVPPYGPGRQVGGAPPAVR